MSLSEPALSKGRNIVGDRFFSSLQLAEDLLLKRATYPGTMNKNKRELPPVLKEENESVTLQSYQVRAKK